jgi:hypothetical protein
MDTNGYWPTLDSIILGLGVADLLVNLHRLIEARRRVTWDPLPLLWAVVVLLWLFNYWWAVATNLDGSQNARVVADFVLLAIPPIILFLMAASVLRTPHRSKAGSTCARTGRIDAACFSPSLRSIKPSPGSRW